MSLAADKRQYVKAVQAYNGGDGTAIMTDAEFDALEDRIRAQDPEWGPLHQTGVIDAEKEDVKLAHFMPSLDKHYPEQISKWVDKKAKFLGPDGLAVISDKLDGSSIQVGYRKGKPHFMATRGDGETGGDISFLLPFMSIPKTIPMQADTYLRCEAVMQEKVFQAKYSVKALGPKEGKKTARAAVAGILNRSGVRINAAMLADIDVVVLGVFGLGMLDGFQRASSWGFKTPSHAWTAFSMVTPAWLDNQLTQTLKYSPYAMDGLVVAVNCRLEYEGNERPTWATAYKRNVTVADALQTTVRRIQWDQSHAGKWTPTAQFDPIVMDGVTVSQASLYSAEWMRGRKIGPGAVVKVIRSGEVIPKVIAVVVPAPEMQWPPGKFEWRGAYIYGTEESGMQRCKRIERFLEVLGVEDIKIRTIQTLHDGGYDRIWKILELFSNPPELKRVFVSLGIGPAKAVRLYDQREKLLNNTLKNYVLASSCFEGIGESRFDALNTDGIPLKKILADNPEFSRTRQSIADTHGFGDATADAIMAGLKKWQKFWPTIEHLVTLKQQQAASGKWLGKTAVWTGYRNKDEEAAFVANGGKVSSSVTKSTSYLFYKSGGKSGSKADKAQALGVRVLTWAELNNG